MEVQSNCNTGADLELACGSLYMRVRQNQRVYFVGMDVGEHLTSMYFNNLIPTELFLTYSVAAFGDKWVSGLTFVLLAIQ